MENSTFEALYTGVYIFIFIAAFTTTLYMFRNVNELAEKSYEYGKQVEGKTLIEAPSESNQYITSSEVISYYFNYVKRDNFDNKNDFQKDVTVEFNDAYLNKTNLTYSQVYNHVLNKTFYIQANKVDNNGKYSFVIKSL